MILISDGTMPLARGEMVRRRELSEWIAGPGAGLLTAMPMAVAAKDEVSHFREARHFASLFGFTPKERSSGGTRHLGRMSRCGERYLRMLLTHGARSVLRAASAEVHAGKTVGALRH